MYKAQAPQLAYKAWQGKSKAQTCRRLRLVCKVQDTITSLNSKAAQVKYVQSEFYYCCCTGCLLAIPMDKVPNVFLHRITTFNSVKAWSLVGTDLYGSMTGRYQTIAIPGCSTATMSATGPSV